MVESLERLLTGVRSKQDYRRLLTTGLEQYINQDTEKYVAKAAKAGYTQHNQYQAKKVKSTLSYIANLGKIAALAGFIALGPAAVTPALFYAPLGLQLFADRKQIGENFKEGPTGYLKNLFWLGKQAAYVGGHLLGLPVATTYGPLIAAEGAEVVKGAMDNRRAKKSGLSEKIETFYKHRESLMKDLGVYKSPSPSMTPQELEAAFGGPLRPKYSPGRQLQPN